MHMFQFSMCRPALSFVLLLSDTCRCIPILNNTTQQDDPASEQQAAEQRSITPTGDASTQNSTSQSQQQHHLTATQQAVVGLSNLGNTCFFNSSVQLLLSCAPLQEMLVQKESDITRGPLGFALQQAALHAAGEAGGECGMG